MFDKILLIINGKIIIELIIIIGLFLEIILLYKVKQKFDLEEQILYQKIIYRFEIQLEQKQYDKIYNLLFQTLMVVVLPTEHMFRDLLIILEKFDCVLIEIILGLQVLKIECIEI